MNNKTNPMCSIVMLSYNQLNYTKACIESIRCYTEDVSYEIIVVDNHSSDPECVSYLEKQKDVHLIAEKENLGFAGGCNEGIKAAKGKYIMLLNNDTIVTKRWLSNMIALLEERPEIAMTGPLTNATVGKQMITVPYGDDLAQMQQYAEQIATSDASPWRTLRLVFFCVLIRRELFDEIGLLSEDFKIGNYEDDDFNLRVLMKQRQMYICRTSFIHHFMNVTFKSPDVKREQIMMRNKMVLERKWDHMDWNHHAVYNRYMLEQLRRDDVKNVLHIGCGLGSLSIELKEQNAEIKVIGVEAHPIRRTIAKQFVDEIYAMDEQMQFLSELKKQAYDAAIIECSLEILGTSLLTKMRPYLKQGAKVYLRVFNFRHVTTLERVIYGKVAGDLLCATSKDFRYFYDETLRDQLEALGYQVMEEKEIKKTLSSRQVQLMEKVGNESGYEKYGTVYNRIYQLKVKE